MAQFKADVRYDAGPTGCRELIMNVFFEMEKWRLDKSWRSSADFSERVEAPSAVDYLLAALASFLLSAFKQTPPREGLTIDAVECTMKGRLHNVLYHMGVEETHHFLRGTGSFFGF